MTEQARTRPEPFMLDFTATAEVRDHPYRWVVIRDLVPVALRAKLRRDLPALGEEWRVARHDGGDKNYGMYVMPLVDHDRELPTLADQAEPLRHLVAALTGDSYRSWVGNTLGVDVTRCRFDVGVFHFRCADYVTPHTDKAGKVATHVLYFNEKEWQPDFGGAFEVRTSADPADAPVATIGPSQGRSVLFARSDNSWHSVSSVTAPPGIVRWTMQVEMWDATSR